MYTWVAQTPAGVIHCDSKNVMNRSLMRYKIARIRTRIFIPVAIALALALAVSVFSIKWYVQWHIDREVQLVLNSFKQLFETKLDQDAILLRKLTDLAATNKDIQQAWLAKDRDSLLLAAQALFYRLGDRHNITHFSFIDPDKSCFLRVHEPQRHGDRIDRFTLDKAVGQAAMEWNWMNSERLRCSRLARGR